MASINRSRASLRVFGDDLVPDEVSLLLGASPSQGYRKGDTRTFSGRQTLRRTGMWLLVADERVPEDINGQVDELLSKLTDDLKVWQLLGSKFQVDLFCGLFMEESNEGFTISPRTLMALAERGIEPDFDIYAPSEDHEHEADQQEA